MNEDAQDIFREMDAFFDHLFTRMSKNIGMGIPRAYSYHIVIQDIDNPPENLNEPGTIPSRSGSEPIPEVHRIDNDVMVIVELSGATRESVTIAVVGNELIIDAYGSDRQYHTTAALPPVDRDSMQTSIKNSVLEVKFRIPEESF